MEPNLSLSTLQNELHCVCARWFTFGVQLHINAGTLRRIHLEHGTDVTRCLLELLIEWLKDTPSWKDIVKALRCPAMAEYSLADRIEVQYCHGSHRLSKSEPMCSPPTWKWNVDVNSSQQVFAFPEFVGATQKREQHGYFRLQRPTSLPESGS